MQSMGTQAMAPLEIDGSRVGTLELQGFTVPYVDLEDEPFVHTQLLVDGTEYVYDRSFPIKGHGAVMPGAVAKLLEQGREVFVAERSERYYVYLA